MHYLLPSIENNQWEKVVPPLTIRQRSIVKHLSEGKSNKETWLLCGISRRSYFAELDALRITHDCTTNIQLVIKLRDIMSGKIIAR